MKTIENRLSDNDQGAASSDDDDVDNGRLATEERHPFGNLRTKDERGVQGLFTLTHKTRDLIYAESIYRMVAEATDCTLKALESSSTIPSDSNPSQFASATLNSALSDLQDFKLSLKDSEQLHSVLDIPVSLAKRWVTSEYLPMFHDYTTLRLPEDID